MVAVTLAFRVQPYKKAEALSAVDALSQRMRVAPGCRRTRLLGDTDDANAFVLVSEWSDIDAADAFLGSREFQIFLGIRFLLREEPVLMLDDVRTRATRLLKHLSGA